MKTYKYESYFGGRRTWHTVEANNKREAIEKASKQWWGHITIRTFRLVKKSK